MKSGIIKTQSSGEPRALLLASLCLLIVASSALAERNLNPSVVPPNATFRGQTYGEWGATWWSALFSIPIENFNDPDNADHPYFSGGAFGVENGVVFLAATAGQEDGTPTIIDITVPAGSAILVPVLNVECSSLEGDGDTEEGLRACANGHLDNTSDLHATIDGVPVANLGAYRVESPLFEFALGEDNLFAFFGLDAPAGTTSASVDAGIYLLLRPLSKGSSHTVEVGGIFHDFDDFTINTKFNITVD